MCNTLWSIISKHPNRFYVCNKDATREISVALFTVHVFTNNLFVSHPKRISSVSIEMSRRGSETSDRLTESLVSRFETVNTIQSGMDCGERRLRMKVNINVVSPSLILTETDCRRVVCDRDREYQHERATLVNSVSYGWSVQLMGTGMRASACHLFSINRSMRISVPRLLRRENRRDNRHGSGCFVENRLSTSVQSLDFRQFNNVLKYWPICAKERIFDI